MARHALTAVSLAALLVAGRAHATAGTAFLESSRQAALGGAVSARPGDAGTMLSNPAGLGDLEEPVVLFVASAARLEQTFQRSGEAAEEDARWLGGFSLAAATPLPGPLRPVRFGIALDLPAEYALRVTVHERLDFPKSPIYDGRPDRMSAAAALGFDLLKQLKLDVGVVLTPSLSLPTEVTYDANRGDTAEEDVVIRLERELEMDVSPFIGLRAQPLAALGVAVVYRDAAISKAAGRQETTAGGIVANDPLDYVQFWQPEELTVGVAAGPFSRFSVSLDATYARWSEHRSPFNQELDQQLVNTLNVGSGVEYALEPWAAVRAGYAFEPSPVPEQVGDTNYLASDTHVISAGGGVDLRRLTGAPLALDGHFRTRLGTTQSAKKRDAALSDASPTTPGQQIDNFGYPGFESSARFYQLGVTLTLFVGKEQRR